MATLQCPHCNHQASVPSLEQLVGRNVKCPSCDQSFVVQAPAEQPNISPAIDVGDSPLPAAASPVITPQPVRGQRKQSILAPLAYNPDGATSAERYPNLLRYIRIIETLQKIFFWIGVVLGLLYVAGIVIMAIGIMFQGEVLAAVGIFFGAVIGLVLYLLIIWLTYIAAMAGTEFLRVVIDVENNTRKQPQP